MSSVSKNMLPYSFAVKSASIKAITPERRDQCIKPTRINSLTTSDTQLAVHLYRKRYCRRDTRPSLVLCQVWNSCLPICLLITNRKGGMLKKNKSNESKKHQQAQRKTSQGDAEKDPVVKVMAEVRGDVGIEFLGEPLATLTVRDACLPGSAGAGVSTDKESQSKPAGPPAPRAQLGLSTRNICRTHMCSWTEDH